MTNVGNAVHKGEISLEDRPCLVDFFVTFSLAWPLDVVSPTTAACGSGAAGVDFFFLGGFFLVLLLGLIFLSVTSC